MARCLVNLANFDRRVPGPHFFLHLGTGRKSGSGCNYAALVSEYLGLLETPARPVEFAQTLFDSTLTNARRRETFFILIGLRVCANANSCLWNSIAFCIWAERARVQNCSLKRKRRRDFNLGRIDRNWWLFHLEFQDAPAKPVACIRLEIGLGFSHSADFSRDISFNALNAS